MCLRLLRERRDVEKSWRFFEKEVETGEETDGESVLLDWRNKRDWTTNLICDICAGWKTPNGQSIDRDRADVVCSSFVAVAVTVHGPRVFNVVMKRGSGIAISDARRKEDVFVTKIIEREAAIFGNGKHSSTKRDSNNSFELFRGHRTELSSACPSAVGKTNKASVGGYV